MSAPLVLAAAGGLLEKLGSYAGIAAIIGLAALSLMYFTQAREVKRLREWAGRAPERAAEVAGRVVADAQRRVVATPMTAPAAVPGVPPPPGFASAGTVPGVPGVAATGVP